MEDTAQLIEAIAKLIGALAWPIVVALGLFLFRLSTLSEVRARYRGGEVQLVRRRDFDDTSQRLRDFWKPDGKVDRANQARIAACMAQLGIGGTVAWLIQAGMPEDRARVIACLSRGAAGGKNAQ
jgi:hypothetical protein